MKTKLKAVHNNKPNTRSRSRDAKAQDQQQQQPTTPTTSANSTDLNSRKKRKLLKDVSANHPSILPCSSQFQNNKAEMFEEHVTSAPGTPSGQGKRELAQMPNAKVLLFALDKFQKKDTYGVFSEPVDPEELPDYLDIIKNPMDFGTIRKNIDGDKYANLEQLEKDVLLICSNAMTYNAPSTIYHRQARAIQELAKKTFEVLRNDLAAFEAEFEQKSATKTKLISSSKKSTKRGSGGKSQVDTGKFELSPALAHNGDHSEKHYGAASYDSSRAKRTSVVESSAAFDAADGIGASERTEDFSGLSFKGLPLRDVKKDTSLEENRRNTYKPWNAFTAVNDSIFLTFLGNSKQLVHCGLQSQYAYARSLARFAAELGPSAWKIAAKKIKESLPQNVPFGQGWVGENEASAQEFAVQNIGKEKHVLAGNGVQSAASLRTGEQESVKTSEARCDRNLIKRDTSDRESSAAISTSVKASQAKSDQNPVRRDASEKESCAFMSTSAPTSSVNTQTAKSTGFQQSKTLAASSQDLQFPSQKLNNTDLRKDLSFVDCNEINLSNSKFASEVSQSRLLEIVSRNGRLTQWASSTQAEELPTAQKISNSGDLGRMLENSTSHSTRESSLETMSSKSLSCVAGISNPLESTPNNYLHRNQAVWTPSSSNSYENNKTDVNQANNSAQGLASEVQKRFSNMAVSSQMMEILSAYSKQTNQRDPTLDLQSQLHSSTLAYTNANMRVQSQMPSNPCYDFPRMQGASSSVPQLNQQLTNLVMPFSLQPLNRMPAQSQELNSDTHATTSLKSSQLFFQHDGWKSYSAHTAYQHKSDHSNLIPPDLNVGFASSNTSSKPSEMTHDSQPDLALQL